MTRASLALPEINPIFFWRTWGKMKSCFRREGPQAPLTRGFHILPVLLGLLLLAAGCSRSARLANVADKQFTPQPARVGPITVSFRLTDAEKPVTGAHVSLEGDMTHAGMAPVFGEARETGPGRYEGQLTLNMSGDWVVLMHITLPDGHTVEDQMHVSGVQNK